MTGNNNAFMEYDLEKYQEAWKKPGALTGMLNWYRALRYKFRRALIKLIYQ